MGDLKKALVNTLTKRLAKARFKTVGEPLVYVLTAAHAKRLFSIYQRRKPRYLTTHWAM